MTVRQLRLVVHATDYDQALPKPRSRAERAPVAPPTLTPWNSINARFDVPGEVHLTLFEERA